MRKELVEWHVDQLMAEQEEHGGSLVIFAEYSDCDDSGVCLIKGDERILTLTIIALLGFVDPKDVDRALKSMEIQTEECHE